MLYIFWILGMLAFKWAIVDQCQCILWCVRILLAKLTQLSTTSETLSYINVYREVLFARREDEHWAGGRQLRPPEWRRGGCPHNLKNPPNPPRAQGWELKSFRFTILDNFFIFKILFVFQGEEAAHTISTVLLVLPGARTQILQKEFLR